MILYTRVLIHAIVDQEIQTKQGPTHQNTSGTKKTKKQNKNKKTGSLQNKTPSSVLWISNVIIGGLSRITSNNSVVKCQSASISVANLNTPTAQFK